MYRQQLYARTKILSPTAVRQYAQDTGWEAVTGSRRRIWLFKHPAVKLVQLQIPMEPDEDIAEALFE